MSTTPLPKSRRNRLSPYTAAERRLNKTIVLDDRPIVTRHLERGLSRKSFGRKTNSTHASN